MLLERLPRSNVSLTLKILDAAPVHTSLIYFLDDIKYTREKLSAAPLYYCEQLQWKTAWLFPVPTITTGEFISCMEITTRPFYTTWVSLQFLQFVVALVNISEWSHNLHPKELWNPSYLWSGSAWNIHQLKEWLGHMNILWVCISGQQSIAGPVGWPMSAKELQIQRNPGGLLRIAPPLKEIINSKGVRLGLLFT